MDSIESMAKARGMGEKMIKQVIANANRSRFIARKKQDIHANSRKGWSLNRGKTMLSMSVMTPAIYLLVKDRYFPDGADDQTKAKLAEEFYRDYPQFRSR